MRRVFNLPNLKKLRRDLRNYRPPAEHILWRYLRGRKFLGLKFRRQQSIGNFIVDFYCPEKKIIIEVDGNSHYGNLEQIRDTVRSKYFVSLGLRVVRFRNDQALYNIDDVLSQLQKFITTPEPLLI